MLRVWFLLWAGMFVLLYPMGPEASDLLVGPYLQNLKPDAVTIMWETTSPAVGKVIYGEDVFENSAADVRSATMHEVTLKGLRPGNTYKYRCAWGDQISEPAQFKTAPPLGTRECRIAVYGDSRSAPETHARTASLIAREAPDIVLHTGDLVTDGTVYAQWKPEFLDPILPYASSITWFTVAGNHERESAHYYNYVSLPGNESWWSTDYANVHIIGLDSCLAADEKSEQYQWLVRDLQNNRQEWTIVFFHHPLFSGHATRPVPSFRSAWQSLFMEYGVDLVFVGHDHHYYRTYPIGGVVHITTGGGGAPLYPAVERPYCAHRRACHHFVLLDVGGDRIVGRVIEKEGKGIDAFILDKQSVPSPEEFVSYEALAVESNLEKAVAEQAPVPVRGKKCTVKFDLKSETDFRVPVILRGKWQGETRWVIEPASFLLKLRPEAALGIPVKAEARSDGVYPLPVLELEVTVDQSGRAFTDPQIGFRNRTMRIRPLRVWVEEEAKPRRVKRAPIIDGLLDESDWKKAFLVNRFLTDGGTGFLGKKTEVMLMADKEKLFIGARVEQDPLGLRDFPYTGRDNAQLDRVENIGIQVWNGELVYQFIITAAGDVLDMRGSTADWSCDVLAMTKIGGNGWTAEAAIPLADMAREAPEKAVWKINVSRQDGATGERGGWIPVFSGSPTDPSQFAELSL